MSDAPEDREPEVDRHDRQTGRQLAFLAGAGAVLTGGVAVSSCGVVAEIFAAYALACLGLVVVTVLALRHPIVAIRLISGRWGELARHPRFDRAPPSVREIAEKRSEGVPLTAAALEAAVPDKERRAKLGRRLMSAAAALVGLSFALSALGDVARDLGGLLIQLAMFGGFVGLVVWYRTL